MSSSIASSGSSFGRRFNRFSRFKRFLAMTAPSAGSAAPVPTPGSGEKPGDHVERGATAGEILLYVGISAVILAFVGGIALTVTSGQRLNQAASELNMLIWAGEKYRSTNRAYGGTGVTNVTVQRLVDRAYGLSKKKYSDGTNENVYGLTMTIASASGGSNATITYQTDTEEACLQLGDQMANNTMLTVGSSPCTGSGPYTLTVTLN